METPFTQRQVSTGEHLLQAGELLVLHLDVVVTEASVRAILECARKHGPAPPLSILYVLEPPAARIPEDRVRAVFVELSRLGETHFSAAAIVVPTGGFAAAMAHGFVSGVRALARARLPLAVCTTVPEGLAWLRKHTPKGARLPLDSATLAALQPLRPR